MVFWAILALMFVPLWPVCLQHMDRQPQGRLCPGSALVLLSRDVFVVMGAALLEDELVHSFLTEF